MSVLEIILTFVGVCIALFGLLGAFGNAHAELGDFGFGVMLLLIGGCIAYFGGVKPYLNKQHTEKVAMQYLVAKAFPTMHAVHIDGDSVSYHVTTEPRIVCFAAVHLEDGKLRVEYWKSERQHEIVNDTADRLTCQVPLETHLAAAVGG